MTKHYEPMGIFTCGAAGTGKTTNQKREVDRTLRERDRAEIPTNLVVYDPDGGPQGWNVKGQVEVYTRGELFTAMLDTRKPGKGRFKDCSFGPPIVLRAPIENWDPPIPKDHPQKQRMEAQVSPFWYWTELVIDEGASLMTPSRLPPSLHKLFARGRKWGTGYNVGSQRPREIHNAVIGNAHRAVILPLSTDTDWKKLEGLDGFALPEGYQWKPVMKNGAPLGRAVQPVTWTRSPLKIELP